MEYGSHKEDNLPIRDLGLVLEHVVRLETDPVVEVDGQKRFPPSTNRLVVLNKESKSRVSSGQLDANVANRAGDLIIACETWDAAGKRRSGEGGE